MEKNKATLKTLSKDELTAVALDIFKAYPKAQKVVVASDGQAFVTDEGDHAAKNHSKNNAYGKELTLTPFNRDDMKSESSEGDDSGRKLANDVIALIEAAETVDAVNALVEGDTRATVVAAATKRIETLNAAQ